MFVQTERWDQFLVFIAIDLGAIGLAIEYRETSSLVEVPLDQLRKHVLVLLV